MIENYSLDKIKEFGSMQVTLLNGRLINNNSAFMEIYNFGNNELTKMIQFDKNDKSIFSTLYVNYWLSNKERLHKKYFDLCKKNPFIRFNEVDTIEFVQDAIYIALIDRIFNYSSKLILAHDYADVEAPELLYLLSLLDLLPSDIDTNSNSDYGYFIDMLQAITLDSNSYDIEDIDIINDTTARGVIALEQFLIDMLNERIKLNKYKVTYPYSIRVNESRFICSCSNSLMGICFAKLSLKISGYNLDHKYHQCKYYKCINYFTKVQKRTEYCPECIKNKIPEMLKHRKHNPKRKQKK